MGKDCSILYLTRECSLSTAEAEARWAQDSVDARVSNKFGIVTKVAVLCIGSSDTQGVAPVVEADTRKQSAHVSPGPPVRPSAGTRGASPLREALSRGRSRSPFRSRDRPSIASGSPARSVSRATLRSRSRGLRSIDLGSRAPPVSLPPLPRTA